MATSSTTQNGVTGTATYSVDASGIGWSYITDDIKADFDFLTVDLPNKLDDVQAKIEDAASITDAFYFENGSTVQDISEAAENLKTDINDLKTSLGTLHDAFMTDIDEVNAELEYNYGWVIVGSAHGSVRTVQ